MAYDLGMADEVDSPWMPVVNGGGNLWKAAVSDASDLVRVVESGGGSPENDRASRKSASCPDYSCLP